MPLTLSSSVRQSLTSYAQKYAVDPGVAMGIAQVESGGNQNAVSSKGAVGIMQLKPSTFYSLKNSEGQPFTDINDPQQNMEAGVVYLAQQYQTFGDWPTAAAAYNAGPGAVKAAGGIPPYNETQNYVRKVANLAAQAGSTSSNNTPQNLQNTLNQRGGDPLAPATAVAGQVLTGDEAAALLDSMAVTLQIDQGLDEKPWFKDTGLVTGNPRIRANVQPVSFVVYLDRAMGQMLHVPTSSSTASVTPVELQLNTSLRDISIQSKHVYNRTPSRTGMHVTLWGMQPDMITGNGSTGVFMNQFGLTDFFSVANMTDDVAQLVSNGFRHTAGGGIQATADNIVGSLNLNDPSEAFRVAAQDAFVEFLKLFQMNGNVWHYTASYQGGLSGQDQVRPNAWAPQKGISTFMEHSRNNDVMTRGYIGMKYRNTVYLGYFKALSWTQDADKPFQWNFNFYFQVERTYSALYVANYTSSSTGA